MLHERGERDAEPTHLQEHGGVGLLAEAVEAHARGPEEVHAVDDDGVLAQNLVRDEEIRDQQRRRPDIAKNVVELRPAPALLRGGYLGIWFHPLGHNSLVSRPSAWPLTFSRSQQAGVSLMANLLSLEFRAKIAIDQSKKFSPHDARQRKARTSLGRTYIASLAHTITKRRCEQHSVRVS